jgi:uncharacterized protein YuzE
MEKRRIRDAWLEQALTAPESTETDAVDPDLEHRLARIDEFGGRVLRVIVNHKRTPPCVVTRIFRPEEDAPVRLRVDQRADALYLSLTEAPASRSEEVSPGIIVDYDDQNHVVGIEMLYLSKRAPEVDIRRLLFESIPEVA